MQKTRRIKTKTNANPKRKRVRKKDALPAKQQTELQEFYQDSTKNEKSELLKIQTEIETRIINIKRDIFQIGKLLFRAKNILPHGAFQRWIEETFQNELPYNTAYFYMRVFKVFQHQPKAVQYMPTKHLLMMVNGDFPHDVKELIAKNPKAWDKYKLEQIKECLDGPEKIHDSKRPFQNNNGSFKKIIQSIKMLKKHNLYFSFRPTITSDCKSLIDIFDFFESMKYRFGFEFALKSEYNQIKSSEFTQKDFKSIENQYKQLMDYYYEKIKNKNKIYCGNIVGGLDRLNQQIAKRYACAAGSPTLTFNPDKSIYTCQNLSNQIDANIGSLVDGVNNEKLDIYKVQNVENMVCKDCWLRYLCGGGCLADKYVNNKSTTKPVKLRCALKDMHWTNMLKLYQKVKNNIPSYFRNN